MARPIKPITKGNSKFMGVLVPREDAEAIERLAALLDMSISQILRRGVRHVVDTARANGELSDLEPAA